MTGRPLTHGKAAHAEGWPNAPADSRGDNGIPVSFYFIVARPEAESKGQTACRPTEDAVDDRPVSNTR